MNKKALALIGVGLLVLAAIIYFIFFYDFNAGEETGDPSGQTSTQVQAEPVVSEAPPAGEVASGTPRSAADVSRDQAGQLAIYFADRYGTSSSQADFGNLEDLELFATEPMQTQLRALITSERAKITATPAYSSVTTKAIVPEFAAFSEIGGTASITVKTKRQEVNESGEMRTYDQDLSLTLRKVGGEWKVDSAVWK